MKKIYGRIFAFIRHSPHNQKIMLDSLIKSIGPEVLSAVTEKFGLSQEEASKTVDTTTSSLETTVKSEVGRGNLDGLFFIL